MSLRYFVTILYLALFMVAAINTGPLSKRNNRFVLHHQTELLCHYKGIVNGKEHVLYTSSVNCPCRDEIIVGNMPEGHIMFLKTEVQ